MQLPIAILAIYRFDAMIDTESGLPEMCKYSLALLWLSLSILGNCAKQMSQNSEKDLVELIRYQTWLQNGKWPK